MDEMHVLLRADHDEKDLVVLLYHDIPVEEVLYLSRGGAIIYLHLG